MQKYPEEITVTWTVDDVLPIAEDWGIKLTRQEAARVLYEIDKNSNTDKCTWRNIEAWIDVLYGNRIAEV